MIVSELLNNYRSEFKRDTDVTICVKDVDFGDFLTVQECTIDKLLNDSRYTDLRISNVLYWWVHVSQYEYRICIMI